MSNSANRPMRSLSVTYGGRGTIDPLKRPGIDPGYAGTIETSEPTTNDIPWHQPCHTAAEKRGPPSEIKLASHRLWHRSRGPGTNRGLAFRLSQSSNGNRQYFIFVKSSISPGPVGCQPSVLRVHSLEAGMSSVAKCASHPKCSPACSGGMDFTGIFSPSPIVSAISRIDTPSSCTALYTVTPGPVFSTARRYKCATSFSGAAAQRIAPSPTYTDTPFSRAVWVTSGTSPCLRVSCTCGSRTIATCTPFAATACAACSRSEEHTS